MQAEIEKATAILVGVPLFQCTRAVDLAAFSFGKRRTVRDKHQTTREIGEYALHVQCAWRITPAHNVVVGKGDLYYPADEAQARTPGVPTPRWSCIPLFMATSAPAELIS